MLFRSDNERTYNSNFNLVCKFDIVCKMTECRSYTDAPFGFEGCASYNSCVKNDKYRETFEKCKHNICCEICDRLIRDYSYFFGSLNLNTASYEDEDIDYSEYYGKRCSKCIAKTSNNKKHQ